MSTLGRRALLHGGVATAALFAASRPVSAQVRDAARAGMTRAAAAFIEALEPSQRQAVVFPFGHDERMNWHYVPRGRAGLAFKDMTPAGRAAAHELMKVSLSEVGHAKAVNVVRLEEVLRQLETFGGLLRDPEKYYVSIFGAPGPIDPRQPHYYRMHGPTLLIEYDNSQNRANHIHSVWHDPRNDFGADLLRAHYERGHHHT